MSVEKRDGVWVNTEVPDQTFASRDEARQAGKIVAQVAAEETYADNVAATEALDGAEDTDAATLVIEAAAEFEDATEALADATDVFEQEVRELTDGTVTRETAKQARARENVIFMALYGNTETARAYWTNLANERGYELVTQDTV